MTAAQTAQGKACFIVLPQVSPKGCSWGHSGYVSNIYRCPEVWFSSHPSQRPGQSGPWLSSGKPTIWAGEVGGEQEQRGPCLSWNAAEKCEMKIQAGSWKAFLDVVQVHGDNPWRSYLTRPDLLLRKLHSNKQWPQLFPKAFTGCFWTPHLSHLFFAASDYIGLLDLAFFTKICIRQSSSCSSWDFPPSLFGTQLLFPSVSASSADYLSSLQMPFCHVTFYFCNVPRLALSHAVLAAIYSFYDFVL